MDSLSGSVKTQFNMNATKTRDLGVISWPVNFTETLSLTSGIGANQVNEMFDDDRTLAGGANEELDLSGTLLNAFGDTIAFVGVKLLYIKNNSATETLTVGGAAATAWEPWAGAAGDAVKIPPGGFILWTNPSAAGWAVAAGVTDKLKILNSGGASTTYRIVILGDLVA